MQKVKKISGMFLRQSAKKNVTIHSSFQIFFVIIYYQILQVFHENIQNAEFII